VINTRIESIADGKRIRFLNLYKQLADSQDRLRPEVSADGVHLEEPGYDIWAAALRPIIIEVLGPAATEDRAPPPTGNPGIGG
jgi:lysophospholipase L1-like esterase